MYEELIADLVDNSEEALSDGQRVLKELVGGTALTDPLPTLLSEENQLKEGLLEVIEVRSIASII